MSYRITGLLCLQQQEIVWPRLEKDRISASSEVHTNDMAHTDCVHVALNQRILHRRSQPNLVESLLVYDQDIFVLVS